MRVILSIIDSSKSWMTAITAVLTWSMTC